jgi:hypothetical protein
MKSFENLYLKQIKKTKPEKETGETKKATDVIIKHS